MSVEEEFALMSALEDMMDDDRDISVLEYWKTGFPIEINYN